jgi:hypothetical protein
VALLFEIPPDSSYRLLYSGPVGVSGVDVQQSWDLSALPPYIRERPSFVDDFLVLVRQVDTGVSDVSKDIEFVEVDGVFTEMVLTLTAADEANLIDIEAWFLHSVVR